jgi:Raf kinase inhibitor-like YbhB/YbcL family protein
MQGQYYGYDGPCPPWNDSIWHRYIFTVYALDIEKMPLQGTINGKAALEALQGHILGKAEITGKYSLNPALS